MNVLVTFIVVVLAMQTGLQARSAKRPRACGVESCPAAPTDKLNVHLIAHTHDDVGWLKTVGQYYFGSRNGIQKAGVQYVLDSVIDELLKDVTKRFIYVETSFFWAWWEEQDDSTKADFQMLVDEGRLEFISGAWSMNDEATTNYQSIIDQFTWGFRFLNDTLGECARPHIGWQIDPFGHSREMASLLAQFGFDGLFLGRLDYEDKAQRLATKNMEMVWQGSPANLGASSDIFTQAMFNFYFSPPGFCWDIYCNDDPMIDNVKSQEYNVPARVEEFLAFVKSQEVSYRTNNILVTMGSDFHYQYAHSWFKNIDKLIKYTNEQQNSIGGNVNLFYSTPSCYLNAVNQANVQWPSKQDDFFPYGSDSNSYWTGYFTSKPSIKYLERLGNNFLQVTKQLVSLAGAGSVDDSGITPLRQAMGIMQHHDAITGTMKDHVAQDYGRLMSSALQEAEAAAEAAVNQILYSTAVDTIPVASCLRLNISECSVTEDSSSFVVTVYNPLSRRLTHVVRLPVPDSVYTVQDPQGNQVTVQVVPIHPSVLSLPGRSSSAVNELIFQALDMPPLSLRSYFVTRLAGTATVNAEPRADSLGNAQVNVSLADDGSTLGVSMNGVDIALQQSYSYYLGFDAAGSRASGAYIFRPQSSNTVPVPIQSSTVYKGALVEEAHQVFEGGWISQIVRVYKDDNHVEFEWMVGPIPDENSIGKEVIARYQTDLSNNATFITDSNGRELLERVLNYRPTWSTDVTEPVASNYYPVTSKLVLRDAVAAVEAAVLVDRAQGGTSLADGQIELMLHRRLFKDDGYGVDEELNEQAYGVGLVARGTHYFTAGTTTAAIPSQAVQERFLAQRKLVKPWLFFTPADGTTYQEWADTYSMESSAALQGGWPPIVHILTLEPWSDGRLLLRLEHILEQGEDPLLADTVVINLQDMFPQWTLVSSLETTLGGNQWLEAASRMQWRPQSPSNVTPTTPLDVSIVSLEPMQIRTFIITVQPL